MKRPKPSLFATISLLVLLALGVWANLYIAHMQPGVVAASVNDRRWFSTTAPTPSDPGNWPGEQSVDWSGEWSVEWAGVPAEITAGLGTPMSWAWSSTRSYELYQITWAGDPLTGLQTDYEWSVLRVYHHGWPMDVLTRTSVITKDSGRAITSAWPTPGGHHTAQATTYHPLGLIANPILYALPPWIVLLLLRHTLTRLKRKRRTTKAQCPHCAYDLSGTANLPTCPECGRSAS